MKYRRLIGISFAAMAIALMLQIADHRGNSLKTWPMAEKPAAIPAVVRSLRPVYPYSVVPGGVYSAEELGRAVFRDNLVREHYADFNLATAHVVTTAEVRYAYVSYRMGGRLLWTKHKLRIPKGETLLTDGTNVCRTRCGNRLSEFPHLETSAGEPSDGLLSLPDFTPSLLANNLVGLDSPLVESEAPAPVEVARLAPVLPSSGAAYAMPLPPSHWLPVSLVGIPLPTIYASQPNPKLAKLTPTSTGTDTSLATAVPEPGTLILVPIALSGACAMVALGRKRRGKRPTTVC